MSVVLIRTALVTNKINMYSYLNVVNHKLYTGLNELLTSITVCVASGKFITHNIKSHVYLLYTFRLLLMNPIRTDQIKYYICQFLSWGLKTIWYITVLNNLIFFNKLNILDIVSSYYIDLCYDFWSETHVVFNNRRTHICMKCISKIYKRQEKGNYWPVITK